MTIFSVNVMLHSITLSNEVTLLFFQEAKLERIDIAHWAGLGGVSFIPHEAKGVADDQVRVNLINQRNIELLQRLRTLDSAFSIGESGKSLEFLYKDTKIAFP